MADKRLYLVIDKAGDERLVNAVSPSQALRHVAAGQFDVRVAKPMEVLAFCTSGRNAEEAGDVSATEEVVAEDLLTEG